MKAHEFAHQLELLAALLRSLPNSEVEQTYAAILRAAGNTGDDKGRSTDRPQRRLPLGVEDDLKKMTPIEVENYLNSEVQSYTTSHLVELAERLGVTTSKRQSRDALINMITRFFEANQMDSIIRGARKDEV